MTSPRRTSLLWIVLAILFFAVVAFNVAYGSPPTPPPEPTGDISVTGGDVLGGDVIGGDVDANSSAESYSEGGDSYSEGGDSNSSVGDITFTSPANTTSDIRIENTPDIVTITPGSGDTCKAHIGFGASIPGLGTSLNIPLPGIECRKMRAYDRMVAMRQWQVAEIMFCSLKEVKAEFREYGLDCVDTLTLYSDEPDEIMPIVTDYAHTHDIERVEGVQERVVTVQGAVLAVQNDFDQRLDALEQKPITRSYAQKPWMTDEKRAKLEAVLAE